MGGACCTPEVETERAEIAKHQDVESLLLDMQRYKTSNAGSTDMKLLKRSKATRTKIAAFKERMSKRPEHLRSLTPARSIDIGNDTVDGEPPRPLGISPTAVYGHTNFDRSSADRFMKFREKADHEMKRRSANPGDPEDDARKKGKGKKVKKGRRDDEDKKKTKKKSKEEPEVEEPKKKKKKKKKQKK